MMPAASELLMYSSMTLVSGAEREKSLPLGGDEPGRRSMAQSYGRCGGSEVARTLLNTSFKSKYSDGTPERSESSLEEEVLKAGNKADFRQTAWQCSLHCRMEPVLQSICGLCFTNQGNPRMTGC